MVSELESISPDLETNLDDEFLGDSDTSDFDMLVDEDEESGVAEAVSTQENLDEASTELEEIPVIKETEEISHEILELAGVETTSQPLESVTPKLLDEIDFSSSSIPMLLESIEDSEEVDSSDSENSSLELSDEKDILVEANDNLDLGDRADYDQSLELTDELELVDPLEIIDQLEINDEEASTDELNDLDTGLSLESVEEEAVVGKAVFINEEEEIKDNESVEETLDDSDFDGLTLEEIEESKKGKAVFLPDEGNDTEDESIPTISLEDSLPETNLSLELDDEAKIDGVAEFQIDDPNESLEETSNNENQPSEVATENSLDALETGGLSLEDIEDEKSIFEQEDIPSVDEAVEEEVVRELQLESEIPELTLEDQIPELDASSIEANSDSVPHLEPNMGDQLELVEDFEEFSADEINLDLVEQQLAGEEAETLNENQQEFDIPMLEEAAPNLDFESVKEPESPTLTPCWVVGASLGGPAAVKKFLQSVPKNINACFIIVQHIDEKFLPVLAEILTNNSHFKVEVATGSNQINPGSVYLAPLKGKLIFLQDGSMLVDHSQKWTEPYAPCIDDVISSLARVYKNQSGAIIFSGMGDDGLKGAKEMLALGGKIWAQSVDTCANSSMPEAIIEHQLASVIATPEVLADRFANLFSNEQTNLTLV